MICRSIRQAEKAPRKSYPGRLLPSSIHLVRPWLIIRLRIFGWRLARQARVNHCRGPTVGCSPTLSARPDVLGSSISAPDAFLRTSCLEAGRVTHFLGPLGAGSRTCAAAHRVRFRRIEPTGHAPLIGCSGSRPHFSQVSEVRGEEQKKKHSPSGVT